MQGEAVRVQVDEGLSVSDLASGYGGVPVIEQITLAVRPGTVSAIIGPNGSGKSTLVKTIAGMLKPLCGEIRLDGRIVTRMRTEELARLGLGYVPQLRDVFPGLTVKENLEMGGFLLPRHEVADRLLEVLQLFPLLQPMLTRRVDKLSGGERKMVAIGRVLMLRPTALLLDEPTAGLAPELAHTVLTRYVRRIAASGTAVLLVEQRAAEALQVAEYGHVLVGGHVQLSGTGDELLRRDDVGEMFLGHLPDDTEHGHMHLALGYLADDTEGGQTHLGHGMEPARATED